MWIKIHSTPLELETRTKKMCKASKMILFIWENVSVDERNKERRGEMRWSEEGRKGEGKAGGGVGRSVREGQREEGRDKERRGGD